MRYCNSPPSCSTVQTSAGSLTSRAPSRRSQITYPSTRLRSFRRLLLSLQLLITASQTACYQTRVTRATRRRLTCCILHTHLPSRRLSCTTAKLPQSISRRPPRRKQSLSTAMQPSQPSTTSLLSLLHHQQQPKRQPP